MHSEFPKSPFTCFVVLAVLLSAWVSFRYTVVSIEADKSAENAVDNITNGLKNSHTTSMYFELGILASAQERRAHYQAALQQRELSGNPRFRIDKRVADEILSNAAAEMAPKDDDDSNDFIVLDGGFGPEHARHYPMELVLGKTTLAPNVDLRYPMRSTNRVFAGITKPIGISPESLCLRSHCTFLASR
jgi:hypothetical protein